MAAKTRANSGRVVLTRSSRKTGNVVTSTKVGQAGYALAVRRANGISPVAPVLRLTVSMV